MATAAPAVLSNQLAGLPKIVVLTGGALRDAYLQGATRIVHGYVTRRRGKLHVEANVENLETRKTVLHFSTSDELLAAFAGVAHAIDPGARAFPVTDPAVVEAWIKAIRSQSGFAEVAARAPDFGLLYVTWAESLAARNDRDGALRVVAQALARPTLIGAADRALLELIKVGPDGAASARAEAFDKVAKLSPSDTNTVRGAADANFHARRYDQAIAQYRAAFALEPRNYPLLNLVGYAQALKGDLAGGRQSIEEYGRLPGQEANGFDSLGEIHFFHGKFAEAEKYFLEAHAQNPAMIGGYDLLKAALARWLAGDAAAADALHLRYVEFIVKQIPGPPVMGPRELLLAQWEWMTARPDAARRRLENRPEYAAQLILWTGEAARLPPPFALLAARKFSEAAEIWKKAYDQSNPSTDGVARTMYAWCLSETGKKAEAKELLKYYPLPQQSDGVFASLVVPRFVELRKQQ